MIKKRLLMMMLLAVLCAVGGYAQKYKANRQHLRLEGAEFVSKAPISNQTSMSINDFTIFPGEKKTVTVYLKSVEPMWMLQVYFKLPTGLSASNARLTNALMSAVNNDNGYSCTANTVSGVYRVVIGNVSKQNAIPVSNGLAVFTMDITASSSITSGNYTISTSDFKFVSATSAEGEGYIGTNTTCKVTVAPPSATGITLDTQNVTLLQGQSLQLNATVSPSYASQEVRWSSSNTGVATVDASGRVTAVSVGNATITATTNDGTNLSATCAVKVNPVLSTSITLNHTEAALYPDQTFQLSATVLPANATNKNVTWSSSNPAIATVDASGKVSAKSIGNTVITATTADGTNLKASCNIIVKPILATSIALNLGSAQINAGETVRLVASVQPANASDKSVTWTSSDPNIATVASDGTVTGVNQGNVVITARTADGSNLTATCAVTVTRPRATSLTLDKEEMEVAIGDEAQIHATVLPANASQNLSWRSSKSSVATVDNTGKITALSEGMTVVIASTTDGSDLIASCVVTVKPVVATEITLDKTTLNLEQGETARITATVLPENTTNKGVNWASTNTAVATVDTNGNVKAVGLGQATITVTTVDGSGLSATCDVSVGSIKVKTVELNQHASQVTIGSNLQLTATILPDNAANKKLTWQSSAPNIASVDNNGLVQALSLGQATISAIATDGSGKKDSCVVTVMPLFITAITLDKTEMTLYLDNTDTIHATVAPTGATIKALSWASNNESVVSVDANGVVTALRTGTAIITATATDGSGVTATCRVTVPVADGNYLSAEPVTIVMGNEVIVPIAMTNSEKITAIQCELRLTGGINVALDEYGEYNIYLSDRAVDHEITCTQRQDFMQILAASITQQPFKSNMGTLYYIHLKADKNLEEGTYMLALRNITLSTVDGQRLKPADVEVTIGLQPYMLGDANGDSHVDVADFLTTANHILFKEPFPFFFRAADVDVNGTVDVNDLSGITNIGLGKASGGTFAPGIGASQPIKAPRKANSTTDNLTIEDFDLAAGETTTLQVELNNSLTYSGMQLDVELPAGLSLASVERATRCRNHTLSTNVLENGATRLWLSSMSSRVINGNTGTLLTLTVKASSTFKGSASMKLTNIVGAHESSDAAGERVELTETVTDINPANVGDINADKTVDVADMNTLLNIMLGRDSADKYGRRAYITKDNNIDVADLNELINIILKK